MYLNKTQSGLLGGAGVVLLASIITGIWLKSGNSEILTKEEIKGINQATNYYTPSGSLGSSDFSNSLNSFDYGINGGSKTKRHKKQKKHKSKKGKKH